VTPAASTTPLASASPLASGSAVPAGSASAAPAASASPRPANKVTVPNLIGIPQAQAEATLRSSSLSAGGASYSTPGTSPYAVGSVIGQNPAPGALVDPNSAVAVVVRR